MSKEAITTYFSQSAEAVDHAARMGQIRRSYLKEAYRAPESKNDRIEYGIDPISLWVQHKKISDKQAAKYMGCSIAEYQALKDDPDGAFSKISPQSVLSFCHGIRVHPAHLGSLDDEFKHSLPPAILAANILIVQDQSEKYGVGDKQLAHYAISVEDSRYSKSFHEDCAFGRLAEKIDSLDVDDLTRLFNLASTLKHVPELQSFSSFVCHQLLQEYEDQHDMCTTSQQSEATNITNKYTKLLSSGYGGLAGLMPKADPYMLVKKLKSSERVRKPKDIQFELKCLAEIMMQEDLNRIWSIGRRQGVDFKWEFALDPELKTASSAIHTYVSALKSGTKVIEKNVEIEKVLAEEIQNLEIWHERLHDYPEEAKIVGRLLANRVQVHRLMHSEEATSLPIPVVK